MRCLLAIPLFILAEASLHKAAQHILGQFRSSGVVSPELRDRFDATIAGVRRLRDASLPWVFVFGAAIAWSVIDQPAVRDDTMSWAVGADGSLGFGGLWFSYVVRPIYLALLPLLALAPALVAARIRAIPAYSALVGEQGRFVHRRWIQGEMIPDNPLLDAPEIGPVADANAMYEAVKKMRSVPIGKGAIIKVLLPIALPFIVVAALQIPLKDLLLKLAKALV